MVRLHQVNPGKASVARPASGPPAVVHTSQMLGRCGVCVGSSPPTCTSGSHQVVRWASPPAQLKLHSLGVSDSDTGPMGRATAVVGTDPKLLPPPEDPTKGGSSFPWLGSVEQVLSGPSLQGLGQVL